MFNQQSPMTMTVLKREEKIQQYTVRKRSAKVSSQMFGSGSSFSPLLSPSSELWSLQDYNYCEFGCKLCSLGLFDLCNKNLPSVKNNYLIIQLVAECMML